MTFSPQTRGSAVRTGDTSHNAAFIFMDYHDYPYDLSFVILSCRYKLVALHSTLSTQDQAAAFTVLPAGVRKVLHASDLCLWSGCAVWLRTGVCKCPLCVFQIVLSTNIAETGVTIPDVVFVIDTGKTKENRQGGRLLTHNFIFSDPPSLVWSEFWKELLHVIKTLKTGLSGM